MAPDVEVVESSPTEILKNLTPAQHKTWRTTGELPEAKPAEKKPEVKDSKTEVAESSPAAKTEITESAPAKAATETTAETVPAKKTEHRPNAESRIKELLAENKKLAQENEKLRTVPAAPAKKDEAPAKPHRNDVDEKTGQAKYATDESFDTAYEKWMTEKVSHDVRKQIAKETEDARISEQNRITQQRLINQLKIGHELYADFAEVLKIDKDGKFQADAIKAIKTNGMIDAWILDSEVSAKMLYFFAKNPAEVERIQSLNSFAAARELTKLEDKLSEAAPASEKKPAESSPTQKTPVKVPPEPATSISGKATAPVDEERAAIDAGDFKRFRQAANAEEWNRKKKAS